MRTPAAAGGRILFWGAFSRSGQKSLQKRVDKMLLMYYCINCLVQKYNLKKANVIEMRQKEELTAVLGALLALALVLSVGLLAFGYAMPWM